MLTSRPLGPAAQDEVNRILSTAEARLFWEQQSIDQRHAYEVAKRVGSALGSNHDAIAAALLHDVGKRHSRLGPVARSLATVCAKLRLPMPASWQQYEAHAAIGASDLSAIGAGELAIAFAAGTPYGEKRVWEVLVAADDGRLKASESAGLGNTIPPEVSR